MFLKSDLLLIFHVIPKGLLLYHSIFVFDHYLLLQSSDFSWFIKNWRAWLCSFINNNNNNNNNKQTNKQITKNQNGCSILAFQTIFLHFALNNFSSILSSVRKWSCLQEQIREIYRIVIYWAIYIHNVFNRMKKKDTLISITAIHI